MDLNKICFCSGPPMFPEGIEIKMHFFLNSVNSLFKIMRCFRLLHVQTITCLLRSSILPSSLPLPLPSSLLSMDNCLSFLNVVARKTHHLRHIINIFQFFIIYGIDTFPEAQCGSSALWSSGISLYWGNSSMSVTVSS